MKRQRRRKKDKTDTASAGYLAGQDNDDEALADTDGGDAEGSDAPENGPEDGDGGESSHGGFGQEDTRQTGDPLTDDSAEADVSVQWPPTDTPAASMPEPVDDSDNDDSAASDPHETPAASMPKPADEPEAEPTEPAAEVSTPDGQLAAVLTGTEHQAAAEALKQLLEAENRGAEPAELWALLTESDVLAKWQTLLDKIETTQTSLEADPDAELGEHTQTAAERLAEQAKQVGDHLVSRLLEWRQAVLDAHCADFEQLCEQATTEPAVPTPADNAAEALAAIIPTETLRTAAEWAVAATATDTTIGGLINAYTTTTGDTPTEAAAALDELRAVPLAALLGSEPVSLKTLIDDLLSRATNPELLADRELTPTPLGWGELPDKYNTNAAIAQKTVTQDTKVLSDLLATDHFRALRWAVQQLHTSLGVLATADSATPAWWRARVGDQGFEVLRWLARYVHEDEWIVHDTAAPRSRVLQTIDNNAETWLHRAGDLIELVPGLDPLAGIMLLAESTTWYDIGDGWMIRWDGTLTEKAAQVLELVGHPMTPDELIATIGDGTVEELIDDLGDELVRIDHHHYIAPTGWGYTPYAAYMDDIDRHIDTAGGTASVASVIAAIARDHGDEAATEAAEHLRSSGLYITTGDLVSRRATDDPDNNNDNS